MKVDRHLVICSWISQNKETGLIERRLKLIGKGSWGVSSSNCISPGVLSKLQNSPLTVGPCRLYNNILGIFNRNNHPGSQLKLVPCLSEIDNVNP